MDLSLLIADTVTIATKQGLGFGKFLLPENSAPSNGILQISAVVSPIDALAPPAVKSSSYKTVRRSLLRKKRRTRRRSLTGGSENGEDCGFFGGGGDCDGAFGSGGGSGGDGGGNWGGGRGWNFDGFEGQNWDEYSSNSWSGSALNFVYEVICWIALSNCVHFAFKKMVRIVVVDTEGREKVPMRY